MPVLMYEVVIPMLILPLAPALLQLLSMEFCYLTMTTIASTWFGIAVFYTILDQLLKVTFNSSEVLKQVSC